jgi:hypothetical protein
VIQVIDLTPRPISTTESSDSNRSDRGWCG